MRQFSGIVALMGLLLGGGACVKNPAGLTLADIISFDVSLQKEIYANGKDRCPVTVVLQKDTLDGQEVKFRTLYGRFLSYINQQDATPQKEITVTSVNRRAAAYLVSDTQAVLNQLSAVVGGYTIYADIRFARVSPQRIFLSSNSTRLKADGNDTATLTVRLLPPEEIGGTVTEKTLLIFTAEDTETNELVSDLGRVAFSDASGQAQVQICGRRKGQFKITCAVENQKNVTDSIIIEFIE